ncbi:uncharacterized protein DC041_0010210, partial [Schistosoma bovis]
MILLQILMINGSFDDVKSNFDRWVIELGKSFSELHTITGEPYLKSIYKTTNFGAQEINETIATTYLDTAIKKLENIVNEKTKLVECYYRAKALTIVPPLNETDNCSIKFYIPLKQSPHYDNQYVCYNFSVAHVPTNVYDLCAMWDIQLDEYRLDFFDCRSQPCTMYADPLITDRLIQGTKFNKDKMIKTFRKFSPNGTASYENAITEVFKLFNKKMIKTFRKFSPNGTASYENAITEVFKLFNKKMIKTFRKFSPNGTASYENAITEVFKLFNKTDENFPSNHKCNRMIMIITDSAPGSYEHLFKEFNPQKYLDIIARSNALQDDAYFTWTGVTVRQFNLKNIPNRSFMNGFMQNMLMEPDPVRIDTMIASKEELPKMYTSVAKAVYDKTNKAKRLKEGNLLGVAGVDIPLQSFQDTLRGWK